MLHTTQQYWLFMLTKSPAHSTLAAESLDAVMTAALFDQKVEVVFAGDGLDWCHQTGDFEGTDKLAMLAAMDDCRFFTVDEVIAHSDILPTSSITIEELKTKMNQCDRILSF